MRLVLWIVGALCLTLGAVGYVVIRILKAGDLGPTSASWLEDRSYSKEGDRE